jgi:hypothetical protein
MVFYYLFISVLLLGIGLYSCLYFIFKDKHVKISLKNIIFLFIVIGMTFLIKGFLYFLTFLEVIDLNTTDLYFFDPILLLINTSAVVFIFSIISGNNNYKYFLLFYVTIIFSVYFSEIFYILFFFISYLIIFLLCVLISKETFFWVSFSGMLYSFFSFLFAIALMLNLIGLILFETITSLLFALFLFNIMKGIKENIFKINVNKLSNNNSNIILDFVRYFLFIILLMVFVFISTVTIHELGHFVVSKFSDCSLSRIVYEGALPHTEILCQKNDSSSLLFSFLGGIAFPFLFSIFFFIVGGKFMKEIGFSVAGFNLIISYADYLDIGLTETKALFLVILGSILVILAIAFLASSRVEEKTFLELAEGEKDFYIANNSNN